MLWTSAKTPPPKAGAYLVNDEYFGVCIATYTKRNGWSLIDDYCEQLNTSVLHWMDIPEPPRN